MSAGNRAPADWQGLKDAHPFLKESVVCLDTDMQTGTMGKAIPLQQPVQSARGPQGKKTQERRAQTRADGWGKNQIVIPGQSHVHVSIEVHV
jgi:hypothetical protein